MSDNEPKVESKQTGKKNQRKRLRNPVNVVFVKKEH